MAREHCFYEDIFNYIMHGTFWADASDTEKSKVHKESLSYDVVQGNLFYTSLPSRKLQQVITKVSDKKHAILDSHTKTDTSDHLSVKSTCLNLRKKYHWKDMESDVSTFIKTYKEYNSLGNRDVFDSEANGQLESLDRVWKLVEIEIIGPLQLQENEVFLLRITDIFSKWMSYNFLSEINFKKMSDILLQEFSVMGFPAGVRVVGVGNSEKFVDTFEFELKDFRSNVNKINLLLSRDNQLIDLKESRNSCYKEDCTVMDYTIPLKDEQNAQNSSDCDTVNVLKNTEVVHTSGKNTDAAVPELSVESAENGCEVNTDVKTVNIIENCAESKQTISEGPELDNCESIAQMGDGNLITVSETNCTSDVKFSNENVPSILPQVKDYENDMQVEDVAVKSEVKEHESNIEFNKETKTSILPKNYGAQVIINDSKFEGTECSEKAKVSGDKQENEISADTSSKVKISADELENENFNQRLDEEMSESFLSLNDLTQSSNNKNDGVALDNESCQSGSRTSNVQHSCCEDIASTNIPIVKIIGESENSFKDLGDFEAFLKSVEGHGRAGYLLYFISAQQSLLDSETQNLCRTNLQKFIRHFPESWIDKMPYFNIHIRNTISTSCRTPSQLLLHRDPNLLGLYKNPNQSFDIFHVNQASRTSNGSLKGKHVQVQLSVRKNYRMHPLSVSASVKRRSTREPNDSSGLLNQYISAQKQPDEENTMQDFAPPLKARRLSKRISLVKQKAIAKILKNYSLKDPIISLTRLPHSLVESALQGKVDVIFLKKYIQLHCRKAS